MELWWVELCWVELWWVELCWVELWWQVDYVRTELYVTSSAYIDDACIDHLARLDTHLLIRWPSRAHSRDEVEAPSAASAAYVQSW